MDEASIIHTQDCQVRVKINFQFLWKSNKHTYRKKKKYIYSTRKQYISSMNIPESLDKKLEQF